MVKVTRHSISKWLLVIVSMLMLSYALFLISRGAEVSVIEEKVPITRQVTVTQYITKQVAKTQILFSGNDLIIQAWGYRYSGPYHLDVGKTLRVSWEADTSVNVYIMNDIDWQSRFFGAPTRWRTSKVGSSGTIEYYIQHAEPIYIQVLCPTWCSAKLFRWVEEVVWSENVVDPVVHIRAIQTEITQSRTILQTMHVTAGYILAMVSGVLFLAGLTFILAPPGTLFKKTSETSVKLKSYQDYLQNLKQLKSQMNMLKTIYEQGEIDEDTYLRLSNEINEKISSLRNILTQERTVYENELRSLDERVSILKKRLEELMIRRRIGLIDQIAFEREMKQIRKELEDIKSKREYLRSLVEALKAEEI